MFVLLLFMFLLAHHKDSRRIDLVIKNGMHMYLKASSQTERQRWLVAFGSTKQEDLLMERCKLFLWCVPYTKSVLITSFVKLYNELWVW